MRSATLLLFLLLGTALSSCGDPCVNALGAACQEPPAEAPTEYNGAPFTRLTFTSPPFDGTIWITGGIITAEDPSAFDSLTYAGTGPRTMYDRRNGGGWVDLQPYLFPAAFTDGLTTEIQVNPEFTREEAEREARKYGSLIGQLPTELRKDVRTLWIHKGREAFGGGNDNILIHTGMSEVYETWSTGNILEEVLIHEAAHTSLDAYHYPARLTDGAAWLEAVRKDEGCYISTYARDNPLREDIAELFPLYVAVRYFPERISADTRDKVLSCALHRVLYFDAAELDLDEYERN